jgi:hypothetical protein
MAYEKYYFKREPFLPDLEVKMHGREKEWKEIIAFLNESLAGNIIRSFLIIGDYGFGKTFILNKIREAIEDPRASIRNANKTLCVQIRLAETEPATSISYEYVTKIFYNISMPTLFKILKNYHPKNTTFSKTFQSIVKALGSGKEEAFRWLTGESLSSEEKNEIKIRKKFEPRQSLSIFMEFLKLLKICGYKNLLVLLDEFEYAINVYSEAKLTSLFHTYKNIYDRFVEDGGVNRYAKHIQIIALTPRGYDVINDLEKKMRIRTGGGGISPWMERMRFERNQVSLAPLRNDAAKAILMERIERERVKKEVSFKTFPFVHPSFFDTIIEVSKGKPRNILDYSEIVMEEAAREDLKEIDGKFARKILEDYKLI